MMQRLKTIHRLPGRDTRYGRIALLTAYLLGCTGTTAWAQEIDASRPPVMPLSEVTRLPDAQAEPARVPSAQSFAPDEDAAELKPRPRPVARRVSTPPAEVTMEPGKNASWVIARDHINRIVTPFAKPSLRTTSTASTSIEGSIVYIAAPTTDPISLFIFDESDPEQAISLTLTPQDNHAPVSTRVNLIGWEKERARSRLPANPEQALARERQHPYLETLAALLRDVARGQVPDGYGYEALSGEPQPGAPVCDMPGIHIQPLQRLTGADFQIWVARAVNTGHYSVAIQEERCTRTQLRAVAAWPLTTLNVGDSTELYMLVATPNDSEPSIPRPSLIQPWGN